MTQPVMMEVKNLVTRFHTQEGIVYAVNGVSYKLHEGETLGVVGESGSGKSVHVLSIMGLIPSPPGRIESGEVFWRGKADHAYPQWRSQYTSGRAGAGGRT